MTFQRFSFLNNFKFTESYDFTAAEYYRYLSYPLNPQFYSNIVDIPINAGNSIKSILKGIIKCLHENRNKCMFAFPVSIDENNNGFKGLSTSLTLLNNCININASSVIKSTVGKGEDTYYITRNEVMSDAFTPLFCCFHRYELVRQSEDFILCKYVEPVLKIHNKVFTSTGIIEKYIRKKLIDVFIRSLISLRKNIINPFNNPMVLAFDYELKIEIADLHQTIFKNISFRNPYPDVGVIDAMNKSLNDFLYRYKEDVIESLIV